MKIVFVPGLCIPFHGRSLDERPLGGTETGVIRLAEALDGLGHTVTVFSSFENPPLTKPIYLPLKAVQHLGAVDVLISVRDITPLFSGIEAKQRYFWTGDSFDQFHNIGLGDRRTIKRIQGLLAVSEWHADTLCEASGFPREKAFVMRNGINAPYFEGQEQRQRKRLIYSSTPYRGLKHLVQIFPKIRVLHPDAELHVFSGYQVYTGPQGYNKGAEQEYEKLSQRLAAIPGCFVHGNKKQRELTREFMRAAVLAYPNTFDETSCITVMEALAAGCTVVTSRKGALPETVGDLGTLISGTPGTPRYELEFVAAVDRLLSDDQYFTDTSRRAREHGAHWSWKIVAERLGAFLDTQLANGTSL